MRLEIVTSGQRFRAQCAKCGTIMYHCDDVITADLDGASFRSYYCQECVKHLNAEEAAFIAKKLKENHERSSFPVQVQVVRQD